MFPCRIIDRAGERRIHARTACARDLRPGLTSRDYRRDIVMGGFFGGRLCFRLWIWIRLRVYMVSFGLSGSSHFALLDSNVRDYELVHRTSRWIVLVA